MRLGIHKFGAAFGTAAILGMAASGCSVQSTTASEEAASSGQAIATPLKTAPTFASGTVAIKLADEALEVYVRSSDSALMVNGSTVSDSSGNLALAAGSKPTVKSITITDTTGTVGDTIILNYVNGFFGEGSTKAAGTTLSLVSGNSNTVILEGTPGNDYIAFGAKGVTLNNTASSPTLDIASTNVKSWTVFLGAGNDKFTAGGNGTLGAAFTAGVSVYGGAGNDTLVESASVTDKETFSGGLGTDTVDYSARTAAVSVAIDPLGVITSGDTPMTAGDPTQGATEGDVILDAEVVLGSSAADYLMGALTGSTTLNGEGGNDTFCQGKNTYNSGTDTLIGGGGVDTVDYSKRTASLTIVMDNKTASGDPTGNSGHGEGDIIGTDIANVTWGGTAGTSSSTVTGNALNNVFTPGPGTNVINGLAGDDVVEEGLDANNTGADTFNGGAGIDTIDYSSRTKALTIVMDGATASGDAAANSGAGEGDKVGTDVENCYGGSGADSITGNANDNDLEGNDGTDTLVGLAGNDTLLGGKTAANANEKNMLHGNDALDAVAETGAFNVCLNIGSKSGASPDVSTPSSVTASNCAVAQD
jgi:Ca2+-binding RTX toxin-like protein